MGVKKATVALFDPTSHELSFASAGHPHPLHFCATGTSARIVEHNNEPPLWVDPARRYHAETSISLKPGERFMLFTDGALEVRNDAGAVLDVDGFTWLAIDAAKRRQDPGQPFLAGIFDGLQRFAGANRLDDDVALLTVAVT